MEINAAGKIETSFLRSFDRRLQENLRASLQKLVSPRRGSFFMPHYPALTRWATIVSRLRRWSFVVEAPTNTQRATSRFWLISVISADQW